MSKKNHFNNPRRRIQEEAARWFARMHNAPADHPDRGRFEAWLLSDGAHAEEFNTFATLMGNFSSTPKLQSMANVIEKNKNLRLEKTRKLQQFISRKGSTLVLVMASGLLIFTMATEWMKQPVMQMASNTDIGQIQKQSLPDGSELVINADSKMDIVYYRDRRTVKLDRGEVIFNVARDIDRPFIIDGGRAKITVLGTRFAVNRLSNLLRVSVDHGSVKVETQDVSGNGIEPPIVLHNGEAIEISPNRKPQKVYRSPQAGFSFAQGSIAFEQASLEEIVETLSRYYATPIIADTNTGNIYVTALVQVNNIEGFIDLLPRIAAVSVTRNNNEILLSSKSN